MTTTRPPAWRRALAGTLAAALLAPGPALAQQAEKALLEGVEAGTDKVSIHLSRPAQFNAFTTAEPPRLVVELLNTEFEGASQAADGKGAFLEKVRAGQYQREPAPIARVVLYLKRLVSYRARWEGPRLDVELMGPVEGSEPTAKPVPEKVADAPAAAAVPAAPAAAAAAGSGAAELEAVEAEGDSASLRLSKQTRFSTSTTQRPPRLIIELSDAVLPGGPKNIPVSGQWLSRVRAVQFKPAPSPVARVVLDLKRMVGYRARWDGATLRVDLQGPAPEAVPAPAPVAAAPKPEPKAEAKPEPKMEAKAAPKPTAVPAPVPAPAPKAVEPIVEEKPAEAVEAKLPKTMTTEASPELARMAGAKTAAAPARAAAPGGPSSARLRRDILATLPSDPITLEFEDMDVHDVLTLLAQKADINIVYGQDVAGALTLQLRDVPFNEAFLTVLSMKGLVANQVGENILRVLTPGALQAERAVSVNQTRVIRLKYAQADDVLKAISSVTSAEGRAGKFVTDKNTNSLIVTDTLEGIASVERLLSELDVRPQQVLIEAKLVEVQLSKDLALGIQWDYLSSDTSEIAGQHGRNLIGTLTHPRSASSPTLPPLDQNADSKPGLGATGRGTGVNLPARNIFGAFTFGRITNNYFLSATLTAAASQGKAKVLSDPKVTTLNGKAAKINITTNIPFVTTETTPAGGGSVTTAQKVAFQTTGITLDVLPTINADGRITLEVKPAVRQPSAVAASAGTTGAISVDSREANTIVLVPDGGTIVIGGLITDTSNETVSKVPLLGDIPLIGYLFRNKFVERKRVELLIFVTTKIVPS